MGRGQVDNLFYGKVAKRPQSTDDREYWRYRQEENDWVGFTSQEIVGGFQDQDTALRHIEKHWSCSRCRAALERKDAGLCTYCQKTSSGS